MAPRDQPQQIRPDALRHHTIDWWCDGCGVQGPQVAISWPGDGRSVLAAIPHHSDWVPTGWILVPVGMTFGSACSLRCADLAFEKITKDPGYLFREGARRALSKMKVSVAGDDT